MQVDISQNPYSLEPSQNEYTGLTSMTQSKYNPSRYTSDQFRPLETKKSNPMLGIVITVALGLAVYSGSVKLFSNSLKGVVSATDPILSPLHKVLGVSPGETEMASEETEEKRRPLLQPPQEVVLPDAPAGPSYRELIVSSAPSGAEIYIDGKNTGLITPSRVKIPTHKPFDISVRRSGYVEYIRPQLDGGKIGPKIDVTLQKAVVGYLDIDVRPPKNARVYINKREVKGRLPITRYPVPANTPLVIQASDPYNRVSAKKIVSVKKNQRSQVIIDLRNVPKARVPSSK